MRKNILLLGGTGTLGTKIKKSKLYPNLKYPLKKELNILDKNKIEKYLIRNNIDLIIHCAAIARLKECETNKAKAKQINITGTKNIVNAISKIKKLSKKKLKLVFISSDAVYPPSRGNNKENDRLGPYNFYGLTKVKGENLVKKLDEFMIIRTRFFDKKKIPFSYSATNIYTSALEVTKFVKYLSILINRNFKGIINVGGPKISDFNKYKKFKKKLKPCDKEDIFKELNFKIATDASLNISKLKKIL